jgi:hypothetical protein
VSTSAWLAICAIVPAVLALAISPLFARGDAIRLGSVASLPISLLAGGAMVIGLRRNTIVSVFAAVSAGMLLRILGVGATAYLAFALLGRSAWLTAFLVTAGCLVAGFVAESVLAYRQLTRENPRG